MIFRASIPLLDGSAWLHAFGPRVLVGIDVVVFIESGVLFPFLPADSLLITPATLAPHLRIQAWQVAVVAAVAAFAADQVGYWLGKRFGRQFFKPDARVLKTERLEQAKVFFACYSRVAVAGAVCAVSWAIVMVVLGVLLGGIPLVAKIIDVLMIVIIAVSVLPIVDSALRRRRSGARATERKQNAPVERVAAGNVGSDACQSGP